MRIKCLLAIAAIFAAITAVQAQEGIWSIQELWQKLVSNPTGDFALKTDIDAAGADFLQPIGSYEQPFRGTLSGLSGDGKTRYTIYGIKMNDEMHGYVGLFGYLGREAVISDLGVEADSVSGKFAVGILAGGNDGVIRRCYTSGKVSGMRQESGNVGGLVGVNGGIIEESWSDAQVGHVAALARTDNTGGLAGMLTANVSGARIVNSFASGTVYGRNNVGGLVGYAFGGAIRQSYAAGLVVGGGTGIGGLLGQDYRNVNTGWKNVGITGSGESAQKAEVTGCFWSETTGQTLSAGGTETRLTGDGMKMATNFRGWDVINVWEVGAGGNPRLRNAPTKFQGAPAKRMLTTDMVSLDYTTIEYNGKEQVPTVTVAAGGAALINGVDYAITRSADNGNDVSNGINVGTVMLTIIGGGDYDGSVVKTYTITKAPPPIVPEYPYFIDSDDKSMWFEPLDEDFPLFDGLSYEYALEKPGVFTPAQWRDEPIFTGLEPDTRYEIYVRLKEHRNYRQGEYGRWTYDNIRTKPVYVPFSINVPKTVEPVALNSKVSVEAEIIVPYDEFVVSYQWYFNYVNKEFDGFFPYEAVPDSLGGNVPHCELRVVVPVSNYYLFLVVGRITPESQGFQPTFDTSAVITVPVINSPASKSAAAIVPEVSVRGRALSVVAPRSEVMTVRLVDMRGRTVSRFRAVGSERFSLSKIPAGIYLMDARIGKRLINRSTVVVK